MYRGLVRWVKLKKCVKYPGRAHRVALRLKLRIDPKIVASGPLVWELRRLQRGHFGAVYGAAGGALMKYWYVLLYQ